MSCWIVLDKPINQIKKIGVLTSGGERFAINAVETLKKMLVLVPDRFEIIIAGGITFENFESLHTLTNGKFYHGKKIINIK